MQCLFHKFHCQLKTYPQLLQEVDYINENIQKKEQKILNLYESLKKWPDCWSAINVKWEPFTWYSLFKPVSAFIFFKCLVKLWYVLEAYTFYKQSNTVVRMKHNTIKTDVIR